MEILAFIGLLVLIFLIRFVIAYIKQHNQVKREGGMAVKYAVVVNWILSEYPGANIYENRGTYLTVGTQSMSSTSIFWMTQTWGTVTIKYSYSSGAFGSFEQEWTFDEKLNQMHMIAQMDYTIKQRMKQI
jgi:hypothetical protein